MKYPVVLYNGEDGWIIAECPAAPGCITQGETRAEALENIREVIALTLEVRQELGLPVPEPDEVLRVCLKSHFLAKRRRISRIIASSTKA